MFIGTVRYNVDPTSIYTDEEIWDILKEVKLFEHVNGLSKKLNQFLGYDSDIFSTGQK